MGSLGIGHAVAARVAGRREGQLDPLDATPLRVFFVQLARGVGRGHHPTLACVLEQDSNRALQQLLSVSNTCSGQVLDFSNTSSHPLSPFRLGIRGLKSLKIVLNWAFLS